MVGHLHDILQYHEVVAYLKSVVDDDKDGETILIGTADHECGGLALVCPCRTFPDWDLMSAFRVVLFPTANINGLLVPWTVLVIPLPT